MANWQSWSETGKYTLYGALFGCGFPVGSVAFLYMIGDLEPAGGLLGLVREAHRNPLLYVIDTAPFFLGLFARLAGIRQDRLRRFSDGLEVQVAEKTESLRRALAEAQRANDVIAHMAEHDALTGLLNRRRFEQELRRWTDHALRYRRPLALLFLDLDDFKQINDRYGHRFGDRYLAAAAEALAATLRSTDFAARWGGDEFAVLLPETEAPAAARVAEKLLARFHTTRVEVAGERLEVRTSIGVAVLPEHAAAANELLARADAAMYRAKQSGRNRWHLYSPSEAESDRAHEKVRWAARLRRALETDQFVLRYQPVVDLGSGATAHYEALVRMEDRDGRLISPGVFLDYAEQFGLSGSIDAMVLRKAARRLAELAQPDVWISVNLSRATLGDAGFLRTLEETLAATPLRGEQLGFELSERLLLERMSEAIGFARRLKALGCHVVLDDVGLNLALARHLRRLPVDVLKLDGSLVRRLHEPDEQRIAAALAAIARDMSIATVAKFVEDPEIIALIRSLGVRCVQGFALGRPIEAIEPIAVARLA